MTSRPTLMLLAGNMCDARLWDGVLPALAGWPVVTPSLDAATIDAMATQALEARDGPLIPIGFSMGGIVALSMAARAPGRIAAMALLDTNPAADLPERAAARPRQQDTVRAGDLERVVVEELKPHYLAPDNQGDARLRSLLRRMALDLGAEVFVRQSEALRTRADQRAIVAGFGAPLLLACGAEDRLCPPAWHEAMAVLAPHATLRIVAGAGHMLPLERPAVLADLIRRWLHTVELEVPCPIAS